MREDQGLGEGHTETPHRPRPMLTHHAERSLRPAEEDENDQGDTHHGGKGQAPAQPNCPIRVHVDFIVGQGYILDKREDETSLWRDGAVRESGMGLCWGRASPLSLLYIYIVSLIGLSRANLAKPPVQCPSLASQALWNQPYQPIAMTSSFVICPHQSGLF